jgi:hypothetical protein
MKPNYDAFFAGYIDAFNRSLGDSVDADGIRSHFADCFVGAGPTGSSCGANDDSFVETLHQGYAFYRSIGTRRMSVRRVEVTEIDANHDMVRVFYGADYEKDGRSFTIDFDVVYLLETVDGATKIFAFIAGDEMALYRQHGLVE